MRSSFPFPFTAIVGQEEMKLAVVLNVVDPLIGGVLIMGHRGTGKSTAVRALADLLPQISAVNGCPFNCDPKDPTSLCAGCRESSKLTGALKPIPVVELPLGATEDRVCGTIAIERALREGIKTFEPGLLAQANRGFLYIDEVNLLDDHLVDLLLDVAATGRNRVEREVFRTSFTVCSRWFWQSRRANPPTAPRPFWSPHRCDHANRC
jgi:magnesium chelatase subunit I